MKKILMVSFVVGILVGASASEIVDTPSGLNATKLSSFKVSVGVFESSPIYGISYGGNMINKYLTLGADLGLSYTKFTTTDASANIVETDFPMLDYTIRLGHNFNIDGSGLGVYVTLNGLIGGYSHETYKIVTNDVVNEFVILSSFGYGAEVSYVFDNGFIFGAKYSTQTMQDNGVVESKYDVTLMNTYLGYNF